MIWDAIKPVLTTSSEEDKKEVLNKLLKAFLYLNAAMLWMLLLLLTFRATKSFQLIKLIWCSACTINKVEFLAVQPTPLF